MITALKLVFFVQSTLPKLNKDGGIQTMRSKLAFLMTDMGSIRDGAANV
jgi:hypothetical protein